MLLRVAPERIDGTVHVEEHLSDWDFTGWDIRAPSGHAIVWWRLEAIDETAREEDRVGFLGESHGLFTSWIQVHVPRGSCRPCLYRLTWWTQPVRDSLQTTNGGVTRWPDLGSPRAERGETPLTPSWDGEGHRTVLLPRVPLPDLPPSDTGLDGVVPLERPSPAALALLRGDPQEALDWADQNRRINDLLMGRNR